MGYGVWVSVRVGFCRYYRWSRCRSKRGGDKGGGGGVVVIGTCFERSGV